MKKLIYKLSLFTTIVLLVSCAAFEKDPEYAYKVQNATTHAITVKATLDNPNIIGNKNLVEVIPAGETISLWIEGGERGDGVIDIEKNNKTISIFSSLTVQIDGMSSFKNFLEMRFWQYKKENNHIATYTLTVASTDF